MCTIICVNKRHSAPQQSELVNEHHQKNCAVSVLWQHGEAILTLNYLVT